MIQLKLYEELRSQDTQCLNAVNPDCEKRTKINLRITAECHAHLQTLTKTFAKFQKDLGKTVGYPVSKC